MRGSELYVDNQMCRACPRCKAAKVCRVKAILQIDPGETPYLETERCLDCRLCLPACPFGAVKKIENNI